MNLAVVLTARLASERFPGKMLADVEGEPLVAHVLRRLKALEDCGRVVLAVTDRVEDRALAEVGREMGVPVHFWPDRDLVSQMDDAVKAHVPDATHILRALGDCPFLSVELVKRACQVMAERGAEAFLWHLPPESWPVYGAREFPYSRAGWGKIVARARGEDERKHVDMYFHRNRSEFKVVYHAPPPPGYFRDDYRLEVDYPEDLALVRNVAQNMGMRAPLIDVIRYLDDNPSVAKLNREKVEKTGPTTSYERKLRRGWMKAMRGQPVVGWDGRVWEPPDQRAQPVFCDAGRCLVGFGFKGVLHYAATSQMVSGRIGCDCGAGRVWREAEER